MQSIKLRETNCAKGKHRLRDNDFGITWCVDCGILSTKPSNKPLNKKSHESKS